MNTYKQVGRTGTEHPAGEIDATAFRAEMESHIGRFGIAVSKPNERGTRTHRLIKKGGIVRHYATAFDAESASLMMNIEDSYVVEFAR